MWIVLRKTTGSALLMVLLISGFLLAMFASYSTNLRSGLRSVTDIGVTPVRYDEALQRMLATGVGIAPPSEWILTGTGEFMVFSGALTDLDWVKSGDLTLTRSGGFAFCYSGMDGITPLFGCARETASFMLGNNTGSLKLRSLGWWSRIIASPNTRVISPSVRYTIYEPIGNLLLPIITLHTQY